jgi:proteasome accessory factor C
MPPRPATERLGRLLVMVPWLTARRRVPLEEVASTFHLSVEQAELDVLLMGLLGVPPYTGGCNVEVWLDGDDVVAHPQPYLQRPPRLTPSEGFSLLAAGRTLLAVPGATTDGPLQRALTKLESVLGDGRALAVDLQSPPLLEVVRAAVTEGRRLRISYYAAWRDELSDREVDPHVVYQRRGRWYLDAHCHGAAGIRRFRVDRIRSVVDTGESFEPVRADPPSEIFEAPADARRVVLDLPASARWVVESYPVEVLDDGERLRVVVHSVGTAWLERLLLRAGPDARVEEPSDLVGLGSAAAARLLAAYP